MANKKKPLLKPTLSQYQYKPDEIEGAAKAEYNKRLNRGEGTSMAECRKVIQNLRIKVKEDDSFKEELDNLIRIGIDSFNLKRFSLEEKEYATARIAKYTEDLGSKGIEIDKAPNDFAVRQVIELEIQIQREWAFIGCLPIQNKEKVHNDSIKILGEEYRRMLEGLNALEKDAGPPAEKGASLSDLAGEIHKAKKDIKDKQPKVAGEVKELREKKNL